MVWYSISYHAGIDQSLIEIIASSNPSEARQFIYANWSCLIHIITAIVGFYAWTNLFSNQKKHINSYVLFSFPIATIIIISVFNPTQEPSFYYEAKNRYFPFSLHGINKDYHQALENKKQFLALSKNFSFGATAEYNKETQVIILFLGESARADHFGLNGYDRPTTPLLSAQTNLINFSNHCSQASHTLRSLPMILTRATPRDYEVAFKEKSLITAFKEAQFNTYWISNQPDYVFFDETDYNENRSFEADVKTSCANLSCDDQQLIDDFTYYFNKLESGSKNLFIIHGNGSHIPYDIRYTATFDKFKGEGDFKSNVVAQYDNSILYTDYIINSIIEKTKSAGIPSLLMYTSDHGDNLGDDSRELYYHSTMPSSFTSKTPFLIWYSDTYYKSHRDDLETVSNHSSLPISSENVFHTLVSLAGITFSDANQQMQINSSYFQESTQEIYIDKDHTQTLTNMLEYEKQFK
jgi:glucan phosphoethanolaminetransferase (alkaline phosphatase superfamily)